MTYENFKYQVRKLGLNFYILNDLICVQDSKGNALYSVDTTKPCIVCHTKRFSKLDDTMQKAVFTLVYLLARTNINDRGDLYKETKWYLKHRYLNTYNGAGYLCQSPKTLSLRGKTDDIIPMKKFKQKVEELGISCRFYDFGTTVDLVVGDDFVLTFYKHQSDNINIYLKTTLNSDKIHKLIDFCRAMTKAPITKKGRIE